MAVGLFLSLIIFFIPPSPLVETGLLIVATGDCAKTLGDCAKTLAEFFELDRELYMLDFLFADFLELPIDFNGENMPFALVVFVVFFVM